MGLIVAEDVGAITRRGCGNASHKLMVELGRVI
jgi:hypothetical protein